MSTTTNEEIAKLVPAKLRKTIALLAATYALLLAVLELVGVVLPIYFGITSAWTAGAYWLAVWVAVAIIVKLRTNSDSAPVINLTVNHEPVEDEGEEPPKDFSHTWKH